MQQVSSYLLLLVLFQAPVPAHTSRLLLVSTQWPSLIHQHAAVAKELVNRGHEVYVVLDSQNNDRHKFDIQGIGVVTFKLKENEFSVASKTFAVRFGEATFSNQSNPMDFGGKNQAVEDLYFPLANRDCERLLHDIEFLEELRELKFDMALMDYIPYVPAFYLLPHVLGIPHISLTALPFLSQAFHHTRLPLMSSYIPAMMTPFSDKMTFLQRYANHMVSLSAMGFLHGDFMPPPSVSNTSLLEKFAPGKTWNDLFEETLFFICYTDQVLDFPAPTLPHVVRTPGITIRPPKPIKDQDLLQILNGPTEVILMSFGSVGGYMPTDIIQRFLTAFSQVPYVIIWKIVSLDLFQSLDVPSNVVLKTWLPQFDLMAHPNIKLFINHCGNNGQYEALFHGKPMIGFALFLDQQYNCARAEHHGFSIQMDIREFKAEELIQNIYQVVDPKNDYISRVQQAGKVMADATMLPKETAVYWIEHILTFGNNHLKTAAYKLNYWQYFLADIALLVCGLLFVILFVLYQILRCCCM